MTDERGYRPVELFFLVIQEFKKFIYYNPFLRNLLKNVLQKIEDEKSRKETIVNVMQLSNERKKS